MDRKIISNYQALLFDLDGTLAHSMHLHNQAWVECLRRHGKLITEDLIQFYAGVPTKKTVEIFNGRYAWSLSADEIAEEKEQLFLQNLHLIKEIPSVTQVVKDFASQTPMAIVSGGTREIVTKILDTLGLTHEFAACVCAEDVQCGKPSPDPFLLGAKLLGVEPNRCLVFEDGEAGIRGAMAAGMDIVKVEMDFSLTFLAATGRFGA